MYCLKVLLLLVGIQVISGYSLHFGDCPVVQPMKDFNINKFLGKWYVIQKTLKVTNKNQVVTYKNGEVFSDYVISETADRPVVGNTEFHGVLKPYRDQPARMNIKYSHNPGSYDYVVFDTDYDNYAGIVSCQKVLFTNRREAAIMSRKPTLDSDIVDQIRTKLKSFGVSLEDLKIIPQDIAIATEQVESTHQVEEPSVKPYDVCAEEEDAIPVFQDEEVAEGAEVIGEDDSAPVNLDPRID